MGADNDLQAALPEPPPPRPDRRTLAIEEALRRFDGQPVRPPEPRAAPAPARWRLKPPHIAAFATVALVALVSLPIWLSDGDRLFQNSRGESLAETPAFETPSPDAAPALAEAVSPPALELAPTAPPAQSGSIAGEQAKLAPAPSPAPQLATEDISVTATRIARAEQSSAQAVHVVSAPPPPAARATPEFALRQDAEEDDGGANIVVTGSRAMTRTERRAAERARDAGGSEEAGDWNACTVVDPRRDLDACPARLAEGLERAWDGDLDAAIDAFSSAIALAPDPSLAYLNRGIAHQLEGDSGRALADFDRAIARDRDSARNYYHRALLHRARGDERRARADARRAVRLDPSYEAVLP